MNEEILYESDEEDITCEELIKKMKLIWQNEKASVILLEYQKEIIDLLMTQLKIYEENTDINQKELLAQHILKIHIERIKYIITDYSRTRIHKIEEWCDYYLKEAPNNLTPAEKMHATLYQKLISNHLIENVIFQTNPRKDFNLSQFVNSPNSDKFVFCFAMKLVEINVNEDFNANSDMLTISVHAGDQFVAPFRSVETHVKKGSILLI